MGRKIHYTVLAAGLVAVMSYLAVAQEDQASPDEPPVQDPAQVMRQDKTDDTIFTYEKKNLTSLLQIRGSGANRNENNENTGAFGVETLFGQLFLPRAGVPEHNSTGGGYGSVASVIWKPRSSVPASLSEARNRGWTSTCPC